MTDLRKAVEQLTSAGQPGDEQEARAVVRELLAALERGEARAAERRADGSWQVNSWVKAGILLAFRMGKITDQSGTGPLPFFDKDTLPLKRVSAGDNVRIVPGGSAIRAGAYVAPGVVCMPPMYINVGAWVDEGTMVDSHALVGSCAQVGRRVHLSAGAQIGGVLEPAGALPVIIEDEVFVGGNCGVYEGAIIRAGAVLAPGTILTGGTPVYDLVRDTTYRRTDSTPMEIPERAVVVPGSRPATSGKGREMGISLYAPVIIKYRDGKTDARLTLEEALR